MSRAGLSKTGRVAATRQASAIDTQLEQAQERCRHRGGQLTTLRREVLRLLLQRGGTAKAYDLQDDMRIVQGRTAPMTVYRALDFLMEMGLVHRVDSLNSFVYCTHHEVDGTEHAHHALMLACTGCGAVAEQPIPNGAADLVGLIEKQSGFAVTDLEVKGLCGRCRISPRDATHRGERIDAGAPSGSGRRRTRRSS